MTSQYRNRRLGIAALAGACLLAAAVPAAGQDDDDDAAGEGYASGSGVFPEADTSDWKCENCPSTSGLSGSVRVGGGFVSDDSFEFGDFRGLEEEGAFAILGADVLYRDDEARYLDIRGEELGLDSRSLSIEGGQQGRYSLSLDYDEIPHFVSEDTVTPFSGAGSSRQRLPSGWTRAPTTGGMTDLDGNLRDTDIEEERETLGVGLEAMTADHWRFNVDYERSTNEGNRIKGGSFLFSSAQLAAPVDHETELLDASVAYVRERWQVEAAYRLSMFDNDDEALRWDNPFTSANGADEGQLALSPDNEFHRLTLSGSWRSRGSVTVAGQVAAGRMDQDEPFLPATINSGLSTPGLPRDDLGGEVDTRNANVRITGDLTERLGAVAEIDYDERDNDTPRASFVQVATDEIVGSARTNRPFGHERSSAGLTLDYRFSPAFTLSGSASHEEVDRTFQDAKETETDTLWVEGRARPTDRVNLRVRQTHEQRDSDHEPFELTPSENPDLRRFHLAERERDETTMAVDVLLSESATASFSVDFGDDDYTDTAVGLSEGEHRAYTVDVSGRPSEGMTAYGFVSLESVEAEIEGADNVTGAPWRAEQTDDFWTMGVGLDVADLPGKWTRGGVDLTFASGDGDVDVDKRGAAPPFPELKTQRYTLEIFANRPIRKNLDLQVGYLVEDLRENDFFRDDVDPDTIPTVLALGDESADDTVHVFRVALEYGF